VLEDGFDELGASERGSERQVAHGRFLQVVNEFVFTKPPAFALELIVNQVPVNLIERHNITQAKKTQITKLSILALNKNVNPWK